MKPNDAITGPDSMAVPKSTPPRIFRNPEDRSANAPIDEGIVPVGDYVAPEPPKRPKRQKKSSAPNSIVNPDTLLAGLPLQALPPLPPLPPAPPAREKPECDRCRPCPPPVGPTPPQPCNCPPRTYRNPPDVIVAPGEHIEVVTEEGQDVTTYTVSSVPYTVNVDPDTMHGDGVDTPIGANVYAGNKPGLVPSAPNGDKDSRFLDAHGNWILVDFTVDQELDPHSEHAVSNRAVCGGLAVLDDRIDELDSSIQPIPVDTVHGIIDPPTPAESLDFDNENV